jgi:hypothetical protein
MRVGRPDIAFADPALQSRAQAQAKGRRVGRIEMRAKAEEKIAPVDPERFHQALGIYQAALVARDAQGAAAEQTAVPVDRGILAVKKEFPDTKEFESLSVRLQHFTEVVGDKKLAKWGMVNHTDGGIEVHDAVINALAAAPFRKSGVLDKEAFHPLVKAEYTRLEAGEK